jgi:hypothetical protein
VQGLSTVPTPAANNAFTKNDSTARNVSNQRTQSISLPQSQWEHCGTNASCNVPSIQTLDTNGSTKVLVGTPQPQRNPGTFSITSTYPSRVAKVGAVVRITGTGFNAIDGATAPPGSTSSCGNLGAGNTCNPLNGTCVEFLDGANNVIASQPEILGITPTQIVLKSPVACSSPIKVRVTRLDATDPTGRKSAVADFCKN